MSEPSGDHATPEEDGGLGLAVLAARVADDKKADDVVILDVGPILSITGYFVVAGASNPRLGRTVIDAVEEAAKLELDRSPVRSEGLREQQWMLLDYGDVVVHVFVGDVRNFYEIERLYTDAARVDWRGAPVTGDSR
jgi:ribosome-associated protein